MGPAQPELLEPEQLRVGSPVARIRPVQRPFGPVFAVFFIIYKYIQKTVKIIYNLLDEKVPVKFFGPLFARLVCICAKIIP